MGHRKVSGENNNVKKETPHFDDQHLVAYDGRSLWFEYCALLLLLQRSSFCERHDKSLQRKFYVSKCLRMIDDLGSAAKFADFVQRVGPHFVRPEMP
jgi:hypothetical protein